jgi:hypothetical protein
MVWIENSLESDEDSHIPDSSVASEETRRGNSNAVTQSLTENRVQINWKEPRRQAVNESC